MIDLLLSFGVKLPLFAIVAIPTPKIATVLIQ